MLCQSQQSCLVRLCKKMYLQGNIVIMQELIHTMRRRQGRNGFVAIRVDLEKAYDSLSCDFIKDTLITASFPHRLCSTLCTHITTPLVQVLYN